MNFLFIEIAHMILLNLHNIYKIAESTVTAICDASKLDTVEKAPHYRSDAVYKYVMQCV